MEKRIILAFLLSFLFIMLWSRINPATVSAPVNVNATVVNQKSSLAFPSSPALPAVVERQVPNVVEKTQKLENSKIRVIFSNVGGTIKEIFIKEHASTLPATNIVSVVGYAQKEFRLDNITANTITYYYEDSGIKIRQRYEVSEEYLINVQTEMSKLEPIKMYSLDISRLDKKLNNQRDESLFEYSFGFNDKVERKSGAFKFASNETKTISSEVSWVGFRDRYFCLVIKPEFKSSEYNVQVNDEKNINFSVVPRATAKFQPRNLAQYYLFWPTKPRRPSQI
jgi:hypothetical protein